MYQAAITGLLALSLLASQTGEYPVRCYFAVKGVMLFIHLWHLHISVDQFEFFSSCAVAQSTYFCFQGPGCTAYLGAADTIGACCVGQRGGSYLLAGVEVCTSCSDFISRAGPFCLSYM